ncbi:MAG: hypothetical protein ACRCSF_13205 [Mycobacteriaceae bacterium]
MSGEKNVDHRSWVEKLTQAINNEATLKAPPTEVPTLSPDLPSVGKWSEQHTIPASAIREALENKSLQSTTYGLRVEGARITGGCNLMNINYPNTLSFTECFFDEPIQLHKSTLKELILTGSHLAGLHLDGSVTTGTISCNKLTSTGTLSAQATKIGGHFDLTDSQLNPTNGIALNLDKSTLIGSVFCNTLNSTGTLSAQATKIGGQFNLSCATVNTPNLDAINLDKATLTGSLFCNSMVISGAIRAVSARFKKELNLSNSKFDSLTLCSTSIKRLWLRPQASKSIDLSEAKIDALVAPESDLATYDLRTEGLVIKELKGGIRTSIKIAELWLKKFSSENFVPQPWLDVAQNYQNFGEKKEADKLRALIGKKINKKRSLFTRRNNTF